MLRKRREDFLVHDNMDKIASGNITILGTKMVRKRFDGMIPLIVRRLNKMKYRPILIADGLSTDLNHSNNKGRNDLDKANVLVELSMPHPSQVRTICDTLNLPFDKHRKQIATEIMLDRMHQAIGRNSGYHCDCEPC
jgi:hypothetical protein